MMRLRALPGLMPGLIVAAVLGTGLPQVAQANTQKAEPVDIVLKGDAKCTRCHDEADSPEQLAIGKTRHGTRADGRTPTCTSCHGDSDSHINKPDNVEERPKPDVYFGKMGKGSTVPVAERNAACLECHQGGPRIHWQGSAHGTQDVSCTSCHEMHTQHDKVRDKLTQPEVCFACHKQQRAQIERPSRHPTKEGKVACSDCHNPHGSAGPKLMVRDTVVDTCYQCHMEKRGPFIWNHQPVNEDCSICHNPHGSTVANLLKSRPPFLCQQCHEPGHQAAIPVLNPSTGLNNRNVVLARGCLNCHTNIHGSNNPLEASGSRSFRQ